jgi:2-polyprenyl-6-methoxyphenol hydroxylase-like FAD-dependent oxidoreductase
MNTARTVLISGAGIAGPTLAFWLSDYGFTPTLIERAPALRTGGYIIDFWGAGFNVAERMQLSRAGYKVREVRIVDDFGSRIGGFRMDGFRRTLHDRFLSILRGDLSKRIYGTLQNRVETMFGDEIQALSEDRDGVVVEFAHSPRRYFDLVIGADGLHSAVRTLTFGAEPEFEIYLGYCAAVFAVCGYPNRDEDVYVSHSLPGKQVARFALRDRRTVFFLIFDAPEKPAVGHHDTEAQIALLSRVFGECGWESRQILQALDRAEDLYFDPVSQIRLPQWHRGRVALVGDAAFCPSLLAGQGAALAMTSAYILAGELKRAAGNFAIAYPAYQDRLQPFIERKQRQAVGFARQFAPRTRLGLAVRNTMSRLLDVPLIGDMMVNRMFADRFTLSEYG